MKLSSLSLLSAYVLLGCASERHHADSPEYANSYEEAEFEYNEPSALTADPSTEPAIANNESPVSDPAAGSNIEQSTQSLQTTPNTEAEGDELDENPDGLTPTDQLENQSDLDITQRIREAVMDNDSLSFAAKNAKIITQNGRVTLRGEVESEQERAAIAAAAQKVAGASNVTNELQVTK